MSVEFRSRAVIDASVAAAWVLPEAGSSAASTLLGASGIERFYAPDLWVAEIANVIWKRTQRAPKLDAKLAANALAVALTAPLEAIPHRQLAERAFDIAVAAGITVYDALYAAAAEREDATLFTLDGKLAAALLRWDSGFAVVQLA